MPRVRVRKGVRNVPEVGQVPKASEGGIPKYRFSVDPGSRRTGIAIWNDVDWDKLCNPLKTLNLSVTTRKNWLQRTQLITGGFDALVNEYRPEVCYFEQPHYMESSHEASVRGDVIKVAHCLGSLCAVCWRYGCRCVLYEVREWKGQIPKSVIILRVKELLPEITQLDPKHDSWDAIGIGLYAKGLLRVETRTVGEIPRAVAELSEVSARMSRSKARTGGVT